MSSEKESEIFSVFKSDYTLPLEIEGGHTKKELLMEATVLFAKHGYTAVSLNDIASVINIKTASIYNHYSSKENLWDAVLDHTMELYLLYYGKLKEQLQQASSFEDVLEAFFAEPKRMENVFTCYAFSLVQAEQFSSAHAAQIMNDVFLEYSIDFFTGYFDTCVEKGWVQPFDTRATVIMMQHSVLGAISVTVQQLLGRPVPYEPRPAMAALQASILQQVRGKA